MTRATANGQAGSNRLNSFVHHAHAEMTRWDGVWSETASIIFHLQLRPVASAAKLHLDMSCVGVLENIVERFLCDTVERHLRIGG